MVEDKVGIKEYLGIKINYSNEKVLPSYIYLGFFSIARYFPRNIPFIKKK